MIEMTRNVNVNWKPHVAETGVTCYTCHRGQPVPAQIWFKAAAPKMNASTFIGNDFGQNKADGQRRAHVPALRPVLAVPGRQRQIRVLRRRAPAAQGQATARRSRPAEQSYALMMHMSNSLGVNCTFCHNSQALRPQLGAQARRRPGTASAWRET
jgi:photosynthetic reaction center cytochrome c subunit